MSRILSFFHLPQYGDPEQARKAKLLASLIWLTIVFYILFTISAAVLDPVNAFRAVRAIVIAAGISILMLVFLYRRKVLVASVLYPIQLWLIVTVSAISGRGMATPAVQGYLLVVLAAGLLVGWRAGVITGAVCFLTELALTYAELYGLLGVYTGLRSPLTYLIVYTLLSGLVTLFVFYYSAGLKAALDQSSQELAERKRAERMLSESEARIRIFADATFEGIVISIDTKIVEANEQFARLLGYSVSALPGMGVDELIAPESRDVIQRHIQENYTEPYEAFLLRRDGTTFPGEIRGRSITHLGQSARLSVVRDLTAQKQAELEKERMNAQLNERIAELTTLKLGLEQRVAERTASLHQVNDDLNRANRAKDEFLANMSHELRSPLNSILGMSEILTDQLFGPLNAKQEQYIRTIAASGAHLLSLINDILDISKIEAGKFEIYPEPVSVSEICEASIAFIKEMAAKKAISLVSSFDTQATRLMADPKRLKQILVNLLTNAVKFTPTAGKIQFEVRSEPEQERLHFSVADTGIGIAPQDLPRLFQTFMQVDSSLARAQEGTGLGLVLVQRLTEMHGGSVSVESELGAGSRFTVTLPWAAATRPPDAAESAAADPASQPRLAAQTPHRGMLLFAEDNPTNRLMIGEYLESQGYRVILAGNGAEALLLAETVAPDIILMDIQMPVMDGLEAIGRIRSNPKLTSVPIIALTALAMAGDRERCLAAGADDYLTKPVSLRLLEQEIGSLLAKRPRHPASSTPNI
jgi:PAS domain S-box-containing protein